MISDIFSDSFHVYFSKTYVSYSRIYTFACNFPNSFEAIAFYYPGRILLFLLCSVQTSVVPRENTIEWTKKEKWFSVTKQIYCEIKVLIPFSCRIKRQPYTSELDFSGPFISQVDSLQTDYTDPLALFAVSRQPQLGSSKCLIRLSWVSAELPTK